MSKHTKEPWAVLAGTIIIDANKRPILAVPETPEMIPSMDEEIDPFWETRSNAHRIVAAVNACAGITDAQLTACAAAGGFARLIEALEAIPEWYQISPDYAPVCLWCNSTPSDGHGGRDRSGYCLRQAVLAPFTPEAEEE